MLDLASRCHVCCVPPVLGTLEELMRPKWGEDGYEEFIATFTCDGCGSTKQADSREAPPDCDICGSKKNGPTPMKLATEQ